MNLATEHPAIVPQERVPLERAALPDGWLPLTVPQRDLWAATQLDERAGCAYNEPIVLSVRGPFDVEACREGVRTVVRRHEALRLRFHPEGAGQCAMSHMPVAIPLTDLGSAADADRRAALAAWCEAEVAAPFEFTTGPLIRVGIARSGPEDHTVAITTHHLVTDGWSQRILLDELQALYASGRDGRPPRLPEPEQISRFVRDELRRYATPEFDEAARYWTELFADGFSPLSLAAKGATWRGAPMRGARKVVRLPSAIRPGLRAACQAHDCTPFTLLLAVFCLQSHWIARQDDFVIGVHVAGQTAMANSYLMGYCVRMLPFRSQRSDSIDVATFVQQTKSRTLTALRHQIFPLGTLLARVAATNAVPGQSPIRVVFNLDRVGRAPDEHPSAATLRADLSAAARFEVFWNIVESPDALLVECTYDPDRVASARVQRWMSQYETLLARLSERPFPALSELRDAVEPGEGDFTQPPPSARALAAAQFRAARSV